MRHNDKEEKNERHIPTRCYVCEAGCVHFEFGNVMLTFTQEQFTFVAQLFAHVRKDIEPETDAVEWPETLTT